MAEPLDLAAGMPERPEGGRSAARGREPVAGIRKRSGQLGQSRLVAVGQRHKYQCAVRTGQRRAQRRSQQRFRHRDARVLVDPDHFARRAHRGPQGRIHAAQLRGREDRGLNRGEGAGWQQAVGPAERLECGPEGNPRGELHHRHASHLRKERHGPARPWVDLQEEHAVVTHDVLRVEQPAGAERLRDLPQALEDPTAIALGHSLRRIYADRVTGVHARPLDVLDQAGHQHAGPIEHDVDVDLEPFHVGVDAHRTVRIDEGGRAQVFGQLARAIGEVDREAPDHEARPYDHGVPHPARHLERLLD